MCIRLLNGCTVAILSFGWLLVSDGIKCLSLNNWPSQARAILVNINSNELLYYSFPVSVNKCGGSFNTIDDSYTR